VSAACRLYVYILIPPGTPASHERLESHAWRARRFEAKREDLKSSGPLWPMG